eukprot:TRINITY_DN22870_c0_g1_i1.p1 TRINITY_DN22870_c0_g1~~TRINITY_DN22870_c0_g1_i1.p1  ORF type:complete len:126 (+),score=31.26 TRINITY_DN22870_c0_g1_i1:112-489(+)
MCIRDRYESEVQRAQEGSERGGVRQEEWRAVSLEEMRGAAAWKQWSDSRAGGRKHGAAAEQRYEAEWSQRYEHATELSEHHYSAEYETHEYETHQYCDDSLQYDCLLYTSPSPRDRTRSRMPSSA